SAFQSAFPQQGFEFVGIRVPSEVADQPMTKEETHRGALNRFKNAKLEMQTAEFYVGLESGIEGNLTFEWIVIESDTHRGE
ncbi:DUF84 family protein, partial [Vibrio parahaemolyticus]|uniref:DUF84 family protein n=1 Tax=Vibrio parahaemolyticus TaxID=670 RepID=UPI0021110B17